MLIKTSFRLNHPLH